jgi:hypothetical protein
MPPIWLVDNLFDESLYPDNILTATEAADGFPAFRVADGRRDETYWTGTTTNTEQRLTLQGGTSRPATMVVIDRGHNLGGKTVHVEYSDNGSSWTTHVTVTIPTTVGGLLSDTNGCLTAEGAWAKTFSSQNRLWWRLRIPAMGAGLIPQVTGLQIGLSFQQTRGLPFPYSDSENNLFRREVESAAGRIGRSYSYKRRKGTSVVRSDSDAEYANTFGPQLEQVFRDKSAPAWLVLDPATPSKNLINVLSANADWSFAVDYDAWPFPSASIPWIENAPAA